MKDDLLKVRIKSKAKIRHIQFSQETKSCITKIEEWFENLGDNDDEMNETQSAEEHEEKN